MPTGLELGDGGVYLSQQPNLVFLKDTDGDDHADVKQIVLAGFDTADSHHSIHAFTWDPGGGLHFQEGLFNFSQIESVHGPVRKHDSAVFRFEPRTGKFAVFVAYGWSQSLGALHRPLGTELRRRRLERLRIITPRPSRAISIGRGSTASSKPFSRKQWRPTCGCELVTSRNFPDDIQGDYL